MNKIYNKNIENRLVEEASLFINATGYRQNEVAKFVQLDDEYAVDGSGSIFQIVDEIPQKYKELSKKGKLDYTPLLVYVSDNKVYNYAEDAANFTDYEDIEIYDKCVETAYS